MIINITNATRTSQFSPADMAVVALSGEFTAERDMTYFSDSIKNALTTAVVTCDKELRGVCVCRDSLIPDSCEVEIICIAEGFRHIGLGRKLLSHALRNMRTLNIKTAFIWVDERNESAISFLTRFGFKPDGKQRVSQTDRKSEEYRFRIDI